MLNPSIRMIALLSALTAGIALGLALASETWGGLVPCALCLLERWPYRVVVVLALSALIAPPRIAIALLVLVVLTLLANTALAGVHVGVELRWWPSPLPECAAPHFSGGSIAERLASMPTHPAKPCDDPTYLIPGVPLSMAALNMIFALAFAAVLAIFLWRSNGRPR
jgi:disulfide bond formation protein DsbB